MKPNRDRKGAIPRVPGVALRSLEDVVRKKRHRLPHGRGSVTGNLIPSRERKRPVLLVSSVFIAFGGPQAHGHSVEDVGP
jgi:hypothetical protein